MGSTVTVVLWKDRTVKFVKELQTVAGEPRLATVHDGYMTHIVRLRDLHVATMQLPHPCSSPHCPGVECGPDGVLGGAWV